MPEANQLYAQNFIFAAYSLHHYYNILFIYCCISTLLQLKFFKFMLSQKNFLKLAGCAYIAI